MRKIKLLVEFEYDDKIMHGGDANDVEAKTWFFDMLRGSTLILHENNEIGDDLGIIKILEMVPDDEVRAIKESEGRALSDLQGTFDRLWDAQMRAIKKWQAAHPGNEMVMPDHSTMFEWMLNRITELEGK